MDRNYGGVIWTNHALQRLSERGITQGDAWATWKNPDQSRYAKSRNAWIYYRTYGVTKIEVVAAQNERKEWIILSVWSRSLGDRNTHRVKSHKRTSIWNLLRKALSPKKNQS